MLSRLHVVAVSTRDATHELGETDGRDMIRIHAELFFVGLF